MPPKKKLRKRNTQKRHKKRLQRYNLRRWILLGIVLVALLGTGIYLKNKVTFYYTMFFDKHPKKLINTEYETHRINRILVEYQGNTFGMDISHYQRKEDIKWDSLKIISGGIPLDFVVLRATMGNAAKDKHFVNFWQKAQEYKITRGAYHFYRPDENPIYQANNYLASVRLEKGDLFPVLDLEKIPKKKTQKQYIEDVKTWLKIVEQAYGVKPIIYTYYHFYKDYLRGHFSDYPLWLANYNDVLMPSEEDQWTIWQFTENGIVNGVNVKVDLNVFNGRKSGLDKLRIN